MTTLSEFLLARIAEDQDVAETVMSPGLWQEAGDDFERIEDAEGQWAADTIVGNARHIVRWQPARVLAECDAKRRIVEQFQRNEQIGHSSNILAPEVRRTNLTLEGVLLALALPYADHPEYQETWRP